MTPATLCEASSATDTAGPSSGVGLGVLVFELGGWRNRRLSRREIDPTDLDGFRDRAFDAYPGGGILAGAVREHDVRDPAAGRDLRDRSSQPV